MRRSALGTWSSFTAPRRSARPSSGPRAPGRRRRRAASATRPPRETAVRPRAARACTRAAAQPLAACSRRRHVRAARFVWRLFRVQSSMSFYIERDEKEIVERQNKKTTHREHLAGESVGDGPRARRPRRQRPRPRFANSESRESPREAPCVAQRKRRCRVGSESELSDLRCEHILGLHGGFAQGGRSLPS